MLIETLKDLLLPFDELLFHQKYWTKQPLLIKRDNQFYDHLFTLNQFDRIVTCMNHYPTLVALQNSTISQNDINKLKLIELYNQGGTIILDEIEKSDPSLHWLCESCKNTIPFTRKVFANAYLTPPTSQAFKVHADAQDVFILQIHGKKSWRVFKPVFQHPIDRRHTILPDTFPQQEDQLMENILEPGDMLYIPRGFPHEVKTLEDSSLHITFTVIPFTWQDVLSTSTMMLTDIDKRLREALYSRQQSRSEMFEWVHDLLTNAFTFDIVNGAINEIETMSFNNRAPNIEGYFKSAALGFDGILNADTIVGRRQLFPNKVVTLSPTKMIVRTTANELLLENVNESVEFMLKSKTFTIRDIPGQADIETKFQLTEELLKEGILEVLEPK